MIQAANQRQTMTEILLFVSVERLMRYSERNARRNLGSRRMRETAI